MLLRSADDLSDSAVDWIMFRAEQHRTASAKANTRVAAVIGLVFLETSLRTRVGFAAAAARLGAASVEASEQRRSPVSMAESVHDTLRTVAGYVDVVVARVKEELTAPANLTVPIISGGDRGPRAEHPTQGLIDVFALRRLHIAPEHQVIAVCGDLRMRSVRSLFGFLARNPPRRLLLVTVHELGDGLHLPSALEEISERRTLLELEDTDVLYVAGIPHGALDEAGRTRLRVTPGTLEALHPRAAVLCPLPVIDEIDTAARTDSRMRIFQQSDEGLYVRMAILEWVLDPSLF
ncbi:hypothetical protein [Mycobacterium kubicae]|uniref:Aspartate/ornithine carbamoyltransferase carbamoyl-P binding domain-containing protein n=1 Tax=Mycobacterium kubicae TaxID=120959 RepID=A0AAX1J4N4_9MYCO|nr:hypothetical protein [Mycobacterium kubicae]MCV7097495.1 hypothetical protein [Mycobacterium kubicae]ORV96461.1 hypothetical protein AWC13_18640 [Mycobacterium kubicae]QPI36196.1 hypothetical protein I2456_16775 [Mycobacterium kubicae]